MCYSKVSAASMAGICEKAIMLAESHLVVFVIGWLCNMSNRACWKHVSGQMFLVLFRRIGKVQICLPSIFCFVDSSGCYVL